MSEAGKEDSVFGERTTLYLLVAVGDGKLDVKDIDWRYNGALYVLVHTRSVRSCHPEHIHFQEQRRTARSCQWSGRRYLHHLAPGHVRLDTSNRRIRLIIPGRMREIVPPISSYTGRAQLPLKPNVAIYPSETELVSSKANQKAAGM